MATTTAAQVVDALQAAGVQVNAAIRAAVAESCGAAVRQLSAAELADFVRLFKAHAVGNSAAHGKPGPVEFVVGGQAAGAAPAGCASSFGANSASGRQFVANATSDPAARQMIADLLAAGFGAGGITAHDLGRLSLDRLRDLHRNHTFQGYSPNAAAGGDAAGELARLASSLRTAVQGASIAALSHLGAAKLQQLHDDLAAAVVATSASTSAVNRAAQGAGAGFESYSLNAVLDA